MSRLDQFRGLRQIKTNVLLILIVISYSFYPKAIVSNNNVQVSLQYERVYHN